MRRIATSAAFLVVVLLVVGTGSASAETETAAPWWGITTGSRPTDLRSGVGKDEVQKVTVSATGGEFALIDFERFSAEGFVFSEKNAALLKWDATHEEVQEGLESIYGAGDVRVTGGPGDEEGTKPYVITFTAGQGSRPVEPMLAVPGVVVGGEEGLVCGEGATGCRGEASLSELTKGTPDGQLVVEAENLGDARASGCSKVAAGTGKFKDSACTEAAGPGEGEFENTPVTITDKLPEGLTAVAAKGLAGRDKQEESGEVKCAIAPSGKEVTCTMESPGFVRPYEQIELLIGVRVEPGASSGELNTASVLGGGTVGTRTASHAIEVNGTERFGIEDYSLVPENLGGSVDARAGSHPYQVTSVITANSTYNDSAEEERPRTVALAKDEIGELPVGLVGNPTPFEQCTDAQFSTNPPQPLGPHEPAINDCPASSAVGVVLVRLAGPNSVGDNAETAPIFNMVPGPGEPARFGFKVLGLIPVFLNASVRTGSDYGVTISSHDIIQAGWVLSVKLTFWGVPGRRSHDGQRGWVCLAEGFLKAFGSCPVSTALTPPPLLTMPTSCEAPFSSTLRADSWGSAGHPAEVAEPFTYTLPEKLDGCNHLPFSPSIETKPDVPNASASTGLKVDVHVPQTAELNPDGLAESSVKDITVALPEGVQVNPSGGNGLEACTGNPSALAPTQLGSPGDQIGYRGEEKPELEPGLTVPSFTPKLPGSFGIEGPEATLEPGVNFCSNASKVGTVRIKLPVLPHALEGAVYLASQNENPFGSLLAMYIVAEDPVSGTVVKIPGEVSLNQASGQLTATVKNSPQGPLEDAELHFFGGERAPLATPPHCGSYITNAAFVPWAAEKSDEAGVTVHSSSTFNIEHGPGGGPCPGASLPFAPSLHASSSNLDAGAFSPLTTTISREDGSQDMQSVTLHMPAGLSGLLSNVKLCPEAQANAGACGPESLIGETTVSAGVGSDPVSVTGGKVYITEKYAGAPFGLSIVNPVKAGPFDLEHDTSRPNEYEPPCDCVVVRATIEIDPHTAALTVTTDESGPHAIPHLIDGIPVQIKAVNVTINRPGFSFNPTNCNPTRITGSIGSDEGASSPVSVPFQVTNCAVLAFHPKFAVSTSAHTSKVGGASLSVKLTYPNAPFGSQANISQVKVELPKQLPTRLTTLQQACTAAQFNSNPSGCPPGSIVGHAKATTPLLPVPLEGPAYFVSHGGEAFPNLIVVLQGYGVTVDLVGDTFISKNGITSSTFKTVPDAPVGSFELTLPQGAFSALTANTNLCKAKAKLKIPTTFIAQNGSQAHQTTQIAVIGCHKHKKTRHPAKKTKKTRHKK